MVNDTSGSAIPRKNHPQKLRPRLRAKKAVAPGMKRNIGAIIGSKGILFLCECRTVQCMPQRAQTEFLLIIGKFPLIIWKIME